MKIVGYRPEDDNFFAGVLVDTGTMIIEVVIQDDRIVIMPTPERDIVYPTRVILHPTRFHPEVTPWAQAATCALLANPLVFLAEHVL